MAFLNETGLEQVWGKIKTKVSSIENTISDINKAKVDKISGKGLSTNDYTTDEKNKLAGIATGATKVIVDSSLSNTSTNAIQNKVVANMKTNIDDELSNKPSKTGDGASGVWGISVSGNAATATKLATARTISLTGSVTGSGTFDGSDNLSIATTKNHKHTIDEIDKGTTLNKAGNVSAINAAKFDVTRANRLAFLPANAVTIEYTQDNGETWTDYGADDSQKRALFAMTREWTARLGNTGTAAVGFGLRVTIEPIDRYVQVDNLYCWFTTGGHTVKLKIEYSTIGNKTTFTTLRENLDINGWSGANDIAFSAGTFGGNSSQLTNRYAYRFTFMTTAINSNFTNQLPGVSDIRLYGDSAWGTPNKMMAADHIYNWDPSQNVSFPAKVTASNGGFVGNISGNAATATKATQDSAGQQINTTYIKELSIDGKTITYMKGDGKTTGTITTQDTTYSAGTGLTLSGTTFSVKTGYTTSGKNYKVQADSNGNLYVNVPWTDTDTKVTQTAIVASSYTNWRPLILGASNGGTEGFAPDTKTDEVFAVQTLSCQPSSGTIKANIFKGNLNGNADTANKLATARKLTIGSTGKDFDGSAALSWSIDDIGAYSLKDRGTLIPENSDLNNYTTAGNYYVANSTSATTIANTPFTSAGYRLICQIGYTTNNSSYMYQIAFGTNGNIKFRCYSTSAWGDWTSYSKTDHTHSYLSLDGGTLTGNLTAKTLTISGTEAGLTHLKFSREGANYICFPSNGSLSINAEDSASSISAASLLINSTAVKPGKSNSIDLGTTDNKWNNVYATTFDGNATSASKLATARTLTIGGTDKTFDGSGNVSWTLSEIGAAVSNTITGGTTSGPTIKTTVNGVTGSAVTIPSASLTASGIVTTGTQEFKGLKTFHGARFKINDDASQQSIYYNSNSGVILADIFVSQGDTTNITEVKYCVRLRSPNSTPNDSTTGKSEFFAFPSPTAGRTADAHYNVLTTKNTITVPQGGTGATNKSGARTNLGITSGTSLPSASGSSYSAGDIFILY